MTAPDADGWIEWSGGECPVAHGTSVDVLHADGEYFADHKAGVHDLTHFAATDWQFTGGPSDIVFYRVRP